MNVIKKINALSKHWQTKQKDMGGGGRANVNFAQKLIAIISSVGIILTSSFVGVRAENELGERFVDSVTINVSGKSYIGHDENFYNRIKNTTEKYFEVSTKEEMAAISKAVNEGNNFKGVTFKLKNDIDFEGEGLKVDTNVSGERFSVKVTGSLKNCWKPIGNAELSEITQSIEQKDFNFFSGTFDGNGKTIKNMLICDNNGVIGLFGAADGIINSLNLEKPIVISKGTMTDILNPSVGVLCGYSKDKISNCHVKDCKIYGDGLGLVAGVAGFFSKINSCSCTGKFILSNAVSASGLAGFSSNAVSKFYQENIDMPTDLSEYEYYIDKCYADIEIYLSSSTNERNNSAAGLVGQCGETAIKNSYALGKIMLESKGTAGVAGLIGAGPNSNISNCYTAVDINCEVKSFDVGGFLFDCSGKIKLENCYSLGDVKVEFTEGGRFGGFYAKDTVGGEAVQNGVAAQTAGESIVQSGEAVQAEGGETEEAQAAGEGVDYVELNENYMLFSVDPSGESEFSNCFYSKNAKISATCGSQNFEPSDKNFCNNKITKVWGSEKEINSIMPGFNKDNCWIFYEGDYPDLKDNLREKRIANFWAENGITYVNISKKQNISWLKEESYGTHNWYGISDPDGVLEEGSTFHVQWFNSKKISEEEKTRYDEIYQKLDDEYKAYADAGKLWIFDMGVTKPDGIEYKKLNGKVYVYIDLGEDWSKDDLEVIYVAEGEDEKVNFVVLENEVLNPESSSEEKFASVAKLEITHFSPYAILQKDGVFPKTGDRISVLPIASLMALAYVISLRTKKKI